MSFKILLLPPDVDESWPEKIRQAVPGAIAKAFWDPKDALPDIEDADAAYGTVPPELFARAKKLRWICAARAGLGGDWFYDALVKSDVVVTNMRGSYNEHLSAHAVAFLLAFARRFEHYLPQKQWKRGPGMIDLVWPKNSYDRSGYYATNSTTSNSAAASTWLRILSTWSITMSSNTYSLQLAHCRTGNPFTMTIVRSRTLNGRVVTTASILAPQT